MVKSRIYDGGSMTPRRKIPLWSSYRSAFFVASPDSIFFFLCNTDQPQLVITWGQQKENKGNHHPHQGSCNRSNQNICTAILSPDSNHVINIVEMETKQQKTDHENCIVELPLIRLTVWPTETKHHIMSSSLSGFIPDTLITSWAEWHPRK